MEELAYVCRRVRIAHVQRKLMLYTLPALQQDKGNGAAYVMRVQCEEERGAA